MIATSNRCIPRSFTVLQPVFHAEEPLVALPALVHLGVSMAVLDLGRTGCRDQRGLDHRAGLEQQALAAQQVIFQRQDLIGQLLSLQQMA